MSLPALLNLPSESEYRKYFETYYCSTSPILTWDGLPVMFYPDMFDHAFYKRAVKNWRAPKSTLALDRCDRMPWIKAILMDSSIPPRVGYDKAKNCNDSRSRIAFLSQENYLVVIRNDGTKWRFVTAYLVDNDDTAKKIQASPIWTKAK